MGTFMRGSGKDGDKQQAWVSYVANEHKIST